MKVKSKLSVFQKRRTTKCNPRTVTPVSAVCAVFRTQPNAYPPKAWKPDVVPLWSSIAGTANAEEGLVTSQQINSKTCITRSAAECKLLTWCRCPFGRWLFLCRRKNFQNRLFKTQFSVGLNRRTFQNVNAEAMRKHFVNFRRSGSKKCVLAAYHMRGLFRRDANRQRRRGNVNDLWIFSKRLLKIAFPWPMQWGDFLRGHRSKRKNLSDQIEGVIAERKISSPLNKKICEGG